MDFAATTAANYTLAPSTPPSAYLTAIQPLLRGYRSHRVAPPGDPAGVAAGAGEGGPPKGSSAPLPTRHSIGCGSAGQSLAPAALCDKLCRRVNLISRREGRASEVLVETRVRIGGGV